MALTPSEQQEVQVGAERVLNERGDEIYTVTKARILGIASKPINEITETDRNLIRLALES